MRDGRSKKKCLTLQLAGAYSKKVISNFALFIWLIESSRSAQLSPKQKMQSEVWNFVAGRERFLPLRERGLHET